MSAFAAKSQAERLWLVGGALIAFVMILIGYFFFISPQRSETSSVNAQADSARLQNSTLESRITALQTQSQQMPKYRADLAAAQSALPATSGLSDFLRSLQSLGNSTLTHVTTLTVGAPTDVSTVAADTPTSTTTGSTSSTTPAPTPTTSSTATASTVVPTTSGVYGLTIAASISGTPGELNQFLEQLQAVQPRAVLITQLIEGTATTGVTATSAGTTLQLTMQAFVAPSNAAEGAQLAAASH